MIRKKRDTIVKKNIIDRSSLNRICFSYMIFSMLIIANALPPVIRVGAIFTEDERESSIESAFKYAIYRINKEKNLLPNTQLVYDIEYVPRDDSFRTTKKVCRQLEAGVQAIFGPTDALLAGHVQSICEAYDIPHIEVRIDLEYSSKEFSINLYPSHTLLTLAYRDIMMYLNWTKVAIIYEEDYGLFNLMHSSTETKAEMYIRQASPDSYRQVLRAIRQKEIYKIIVDTNPSNIKTFFRSILQLQMNDHRYHYMFTTFDLETYDLEDFRYNSVNITAFRLVDVNSKRYLEVIDQMQKLQHNGLQSINGIPYIQTESALMFDSVYAFASGLHFLNLDSRPNFSVKNLSCTSDQTWDDGISLYNQINAAITDGLTGNINFVEGRRDKFKLDILKLKQEKIQKVGYWQPESGVNISDPTAFYDSNIANITLVVMTRQERPYVMVKEDTNLTGNIRFEGFCIDLLKAIAQQVGFQYKIELVPDNMYGVYIPETNSWNGIVQELMERRADLAVASMTINYARESVIDFTKPFMNLGIGILFKATSTRIVGGCWFFFCLIIISSYTANLAAFLTVERMISPIESASDLAEQTEISYGTLEGGSTMTFFRDSKIGIYQKMWRYMENRKAAVFVKTYEDGIKRVMEGSYAFLMESTMLDYAVQRDCNLTQIGGLLDSKGYGIATPKGSPWRDKISLAILELQEKGIIQILYDKWWKNTGDVCNRDDKSKESKANALGVENIGGVFVVLLCGLALAVVVAIFEFCWNSRKNLNTENQSLCSEMAQELRFAMHCHGSKSKHRPRKRNCLKCSSGPTYVPSNMSMPNVGVHYNYFN
ncbi:glutamate receptor ionotropic, kainate 2 isoform X6 [Drosophila subpulchrella]|uniref:glutamate receptor ionotropic, kainate 2 isoform X6 n=1 Tax=Drosophila subpulchrella TaxID=1486046 RepID=UPI0018A159A3|nr:glutamate receptor ionotropic, kainate 2 isoform X6 [Drosophila subpulchrella]